MLPACRRLLDRHPGCGPLWWVAARILTAGDPAEEAERCADRSSPIRTSDLLREELPARRRAVRHGGVGDVASADVVVVEVDAIGPGGVVLDADDVGLIEAARAVGVPVWVEGGVGRVMPPKLWDALVRRLEGASCGAVRRRSSTSTGSTAWPGPVGVQPVPVALASHRLSRARRAAGPLVASRSTLDLGRG